MGKAKYAQIACDDPDGLAARNELVEIGRPAQSVFNLLADRCSYGNVSYITRSTMLNISDLKRNTVSRGLVALIANDFIIESIKDGSVNGYKLSPFLIFIPILIDGKTQTLSSARRSWLRLVRNN